MAQVGWLVGLSMGFCIVILAEPDVIPPSLDVIRSLNDLTETLVDHPACADDRLQKLWDSLTKRNVVYKETFEELHSLLDDLSRTYSNEPAIEVCTGTHLKYRKTGTGCYSIYNDKRWPWWRSRFFCWLIGGEMIHPRNFEELRQFLSEKAKDKYWIGGRTSSELEFPTWLAEDGQWIGSDADNFTTIPRSSPNANCLAIDSANDSQIISLDCEEKMLTVCKERTKWCKYPYSMAGKDCAKLELDIPSLKWVNADEKCKKGNGRFLTSKKDINLIHRYASRKFSNDDWAVWIGARATTGEDTFYWLDGTEVDFTSHRHDTASEGSCLALTGGLYQTAKYDCDTDSVVWVLCFK